jgi:integrase
MKVAFYLKRPNGEKETAVYARISYNGFRLKYYLPETIHPNNWSTKTQRAKQTLKFANYREFNLHLDNIKNDIENVFRTYQNDNDMIPHPDTFKELLDFEIKKIENENNKSFFEFFQYLIDQSENGVRTHPKTGKPIAKVTVRSYRTIQRHLNEFQQTQRRKIQFKNIDLDFYDSYTKYLIGKTLSNNTIGKHIQIVKMILNEANERGIEINTAYQTKKFKVIREKSEDIYLTENEINKIENLDLKNNKRLELVRDLFLIGCKTGLRYSDYSTLKPENFTDDGYLELIQAKTNDKVVIPVHPKVKAILAKYGGAMPKSISIQKTNDYLKEIGAQIKELQKNVSKTMTKGGQTITRNFNKYQLLTTHTARRSFATNEYLQGTPSQTIMQITGHRTEKAFMKYIKLSSREHAKVLQLSWDKRLANAQ